MPTMLALAPNEIISLYALGGGSFITNYIRGGFDEGMNAVGNSIEINAQLFDPGTEKAG
jgi:hypothetical protein